nr:hypothetical protein Iba_chr12aCG1910 [Ipomoea batatas]
MVRTAGRYVKTEKVGGVLQEDLRTNWETNEQQSNPGRFEEGYYDLLSQEGKLQRRGYNGGRRSFSDLQVLQNCLVRHARQCGKPFKLRSCNAHHDVLQRNERCGQGTLPSSLRRERLQVEIGPKFGFCSILGSLKGSEKPARDSLTISGFPSPFCIPNAMSSRPFEHTCVPNLCSEQLNRTARPRRVPFRVAIEHNMLRFCFEMLPSADSRTDKTSRGLFQPQPENQRNAAFLLIRVLARSGNESCKQNRLCFSLCKLLSDMGRGSHEEALNVASQNLGYKLLRGLFLDIRVGFPTRTRVHPLSPRNPSFTLVHLIPSTFPASMECRLLPLTIFHSSRDFFRFPSIFLHFHAFFLLHLLRSTGLLAVQKCWNQNPYALDRTAGRSPPAFQSPEHRAQGTAARSSLKSVDELPSWTEVIRLFNVEITGGRSRGGCSPTTLAFCPFDILEKFEQDAGSEGHYGGQKGPETRNQKRKWEKI